MISWLSRSWKQCSSQVIHVSLAIPALLAMAHNRGQPKTMLAARLHAPVTCGIREFTVEELREKIKLDRVPIPQPRHGQVLVRVEKSTINPNDMSTLKGTYGKSSIKEATEPQQLGWEGCGTVVAYGGGWLAWM